MSKVRLTVSVDSELAEYLRSTPSISSTIAEAVQVHRARKLEAALEQGYRDDSDEAVRIHREWSKAGVDTAWNPRS